MTAQRGVWSRRKDVHRRVDVDGTVWRITPKVSAPGVVLTMAYRDILLTSGHRDVGAAKLHVDDMLRAFAARTMAEYAAPGEVIHSNDQQVCIEEAML